MQRYGGYDISTAPSHGALSLTPGAGERASSATLAMNEAVAARRAGGIQTLHLGFGEASFPLPAPLREALTRAATQTGYAPVLGLPALREAIAAYLSRTRGLARSAATVATGPGSKPLIYAALQVLAGDVLLPIPSWVSYGPQARLAGKRVFPVVTAPDDAHTLTPDALGAALAAARAAGGDPRILVVNSPSNPTGSMFTQEDVIAVAAWARRENVTLISDEIYAELAHGWRPHVSPAVHYPEGTIVTGGISKAFSAGGWRLGYASLPETPQGQRLMAALRALASEIWSSAATPVQVAATVAFSDDPTLADSVRRAAQVHAYVTARMHRALIQLGITCPRPAGAFYLYPDFARWRTALARRGVATSADLSRLLLNEWSLATLPAAEFGEAPDALRLRLATSLLYSPTWAISQEARDAAHRELLERADTLPADGGDVAGVTLPMVDRALRRLTEFIQSLDALE